jgi:hypothetical protein
MIARWGYSDMNKPDPRLPSLRTIRRRGNAAIAALAAKGPRCRLIGTKEAKKMLQHYRGRG